MRELNVNEIQDISGGKGYGLVIKLFLGIFTGFFSIGIIPGLYPPPYPIPLVVGP